LSLRSSQNDRKQSGDSRTGRLEERCHSRRSLLSTGHEGVRSQRLNWFADPAQRSLSESHYRVPNENFVLVMLAFLGCFQTDSLDEVVERLNHGSRSEEHTSELQSPD